jgi:hypothetical protein
MSNAIEWRGQANGDWVARVGRFYAVVNLRRAFHNDPSTENPWQVTLCVDPIFLPDHKIEGIPYTMCAGQTQHDTIDEAKAAAEQWLHQQESDRDGR